ncbi:AAA family ATPase [Aliarcobacter butzleri]|uniref:DNA 3'-5' helicase II n=1 Tax=Aliarcobacter butzleri TaxID=28197 RepID=A0AAW6VTG6_9BACT|nr:NERD domain-containing protein [Aliarcobacter butzleri]MDK2063028.1 AAA family ATPase [Aliarcobacter butzleri]MDK2070251.1 AAA family ATPase [Aliarcobacter butzleri]
MKSILGLFSKIAKGNQGEALVLESITKLLKTTSNNEENFFIIPKVQIEDATISKEIDMVLLHRVYGLFIIEVKNWEKLEITQENDPFSQVKEYRNLFLNKIKDEFGKVAINVDFRVIFPKLTYEDAKRFFSENKNLSAFKQHSFFKEDLQSKENFKRFFNSSSPTIPNKKDFLKVASLVINKEKIKDSEDKVIPIISNDEILYFDHKQLTVLNGYTDGFRIIRGVAGTGKTIILSHFINNKVNNGEVEKFLILCFNKRLVDSLNTVFEDSEHKSSINIHSLFAFLNLIKFDSEKCNITKDTSFEEKYKIFESDIALEEFSLKLQEYLKTNPIDYFICDETQDMPAGFMRIIYEQIKDCIFFIDEAQKFYSYSMNDISDIFHHPKFQKLSMQGRVKNLKNVYRTPSNIAKCAFEILSNDENINQYYKKSYYLKDSFLNDINFILEDGKIFLDNWNNSDDLKEILEKLEDDTIILTHTKKQVDAISSIVKSLKKEDFIKVMTIQSVKGLEAKNIIVLNFEKYLSMCLIADKDIFYRKLYVILTRASNQLFISFDETKMKDEISKKIFEVLQKHKTATNQINIKIDEKPNLANLSKVKISKDELKKTGELVVLGAELFAVIAGFFA